LKSYLVILAGSPRGGRSTWKSLQKYVLKPLNAKYKWVFKDYSENLDYYEENFSNTWKEYLMTGQDTGLLSSGGVHFVFKDYILNNYIETLKKYDFIIYTRFDQYYCDLHPSGIDNKLLIPEGEDYFGICDRHAIVSKNLIEKFLGICKYIDLPSSMSNLPKFNNCESTFKRHLEFENILTHVERYERSQFTSTLKVRETSLSINYIYLKTKITLGKIKIKL